MYYQMYDGKLIRSYDNNEPDKWLFFKNDHDAMVYFGLLNPYADKEYDYVKPIQQ